VNLARPRAPAVTRGPIIVASNLSNGLDSDSEATPAAGSFGQSLAHRLKAAARRMGPVERLRLLRDHVPGTLTFTTSFGLEDQVLAHFIHVAGIPVRFVTLDTGRLFPETYNVWTATEQRYGIRVHAYYPDAAAVERLVNTQGIDGFYANTTARHACCGIRKVAPLSRALQGASGWLTGLRADQSEVRHGVEFASYDADHDIVKANPLFDWSRAGVEAQAADAEIPLSPLHKRGFKSIGCAPCTRAVTPDEPERAGRWWWETETAKECGLHLTPDGRLARAGSAP
jgi:phosphoadenosine phosphosulfate reductase